MGLEREWGFCRGWLGVGFEMLECEGGVMWVWRELGQSCEDGR